MNYNVYISSADRISGGNNNGVYQVNWSDFLDLKYDRYRVNFVLTTDEAYYLDSAGNNLASSSFNINTNSRSYSFSTTTKNQSNCLGFVTRTTNGFSNITGFPQNNLPVIIERPTSNNINVSFINLHSNGLLVATDASGNLLTDMGPWTAILTFIPVEV